MAQYTKDGVTHTLGTPMQHPDREGFKINPNESWLLANGWTEVTEETTTAETYTPSYEELVEQYIAEQYSPAQETALINNYLAGGDEYAEEYAEYQSYRAVCKARAKEETETETINQ